MDFQAGEFFFKDDLIINQFKGDRGLDYLRHGKHLRAKLCQSFCATIDVREKLAEHMAQIIEHIHNATLTHDDVIDQSSFRRGQETFNQGHGNKKAVLLGDYILAYSLGQLALYECPPLISEVSYCLKSLVDGEWFQAENEDPFKINPGDYRKLAAAKTGSLFSLCFTLPASLKGMSYQTVGILRDLGKELGILFQIKDDLMDFSSQSQKTFGLDWKNHNPNFLMAKLGELYPETDWKNIALEDFMHGQYSDIFDKVQREIITEYENRRQELKENFREQLSQDTEGICHSEMIAFIDLVLEKIGELKWDNP